MFICRSQAHDTYNNYIVSQRVLTMNYLFSASEIKLAQISIAIVAIFLICWSPYVITRAFIAFAGTSFSTDTLSATALIVYISLFSNPIIYSSLRSDLRGQMCCCVNEFPRRNLVVSSDNSTQQCFAVSFNNRKEQMCCCMNKLLRRNMVSRDNSTQ